MPYFGGTFGGRLREQVGLKASGAEMSATEFLHVAEAARLTRQQFTALQKAPAANGSSRPFADGPRCLQVMTENGGIPEGGRNNTLFMIGIYCRRKWPDDWKQRLEEFNSTLMHPPLGAEEVAAAERSLEHKDYDYTCKVEPMCSHCDAAVCRSRTYGVGVGGGYPVIEGLTRVDYSPPEFHVTTPFGRVTVPMRLLYRFDCFNEEVGTQTGRLFTQPPKRHADWLAVLDAAMSEVVVVEPPPDLRAGAEFHELLEEFLTNQSRGYRREDILLGRPWEAEVGEDEGVAGRHWFKLADLMKFLTRMRAKYTRTEAGDELRRLGGDATALKVAGKPVWCWWVPSEAVSRTPEIGPPPMREQAI